MKKIILLFLFSIFLSSLRAQSYEGTIGGHYVWFDLLASGVNGQITGTYFYKNQFREIFLKGQRSLKEIDLTEQGEKNKITGSLTLTDAGDSLFGVWRNPKRTKIYDVLVYKTNPVYKPHEKLVFGENPVGSSDDGYITRSGTSLLFARKNIISSDEWSTTEGGAYPTGERTCSTSYYDSTGILSYLSIWNEIDTSKRVEFRKIINEKIQNCLYETRHKANDSDWVQLLMGGEVGFDSAYLNTVFTWKDDGTRELSSYYYVDERGLNFYYYDYFHFPHVALALDLSCDFCIPLSDLEKYLSRDAVLWRLIKK